MAYSVFRIILNLNVLFAASIIFKSVCLGQEQEEQIKNSQNQNDQSQQGTFRPSLFAHYTYSPLHLTFIANFERQIYDALGQYEQQLMDRLQIIRRFRWDYEDSVSNMLNHIDPNADEWNQASFLTSHPFLIYRMIQRYNNDIRSLYEHVWKNYEKGLLQNFENMRGDYEWPTRQDLTEAANLLLRLQDTYDFKVEQFASGNFHSLPTPVGLTARHCLEIVDFALAKGDTLSAGEWLKAARYKVMVMGDASTNLDLLSNYYQNVARMHGKTWNIDDFNTPDIFHEAKSAIKRDYEDNKFTKTFENRINNFKALCRGENILFPEERSTLHCYHESKRNPYFFINPQRIEVHNVNPEIIEIHNFFEQALVHDISSRALHPLLKSNGHDAPKTQGFLHTRTTSPAWIYDESERMDKVSMKIAYILGVFNTQDEYYDSEPFHVAAFTAGGHYDPCIECEELENEQWKEYSTRVATVQLMLENVEVGGETVFTQLGISITPRKGSVLVFYNVLNNGEIDTRLLHGSCPVLIGHKWVATKFIHLTKLSSPLPLP